MIDGYTPRLREPYRFAGGPLDGARDPYDLLDRDVPVGTQRVVYGDDGAYVASYVMRDGGVWTFHMLLEDGDADPTHDEVQVVVPPPPPPPSRPIPAPPPPPPPPPPPG